MKAQLQIGNEMREGELVAFSHYFNERHSWKVEFEDGSQYKSTAYFPTRDECLAHFKSIGGIILGDAE